MTEIPELTTKDLARAIPAHIRRRLMLGQIESGEDIFCPSALHRVDSGSVCSGDGDQRAHASELGAGPSVSGWASARVASNRGASPAHHPRES